jgi:hypothetical protein
MPFLVTTLLPESLVIVMFPQSFIGSVLLLLYFAQMHVVEVCDVACLCRPFLVHCVQ